MGSSWTLTIPLVERLSQRDLHGQNQQAADGDTFGDPYPSSPAPNSFIFTFQNIGPPKQSAAESAPQLNSSRFSRGNASGSLFAEHCLNESKLPHCDTFNPRMKSKSKHSFSYILNNKHKAPTAGWHLVGGIGFTMNSLFCSQKLNHGGDSTGLGRWSFSAFKEGETQFCVCMQHTVVLKIHAIRVWSETSIAVISVTQESVQIQIQGHYLLMTYADQFQQD